MMLGAALVAAMIYLGALFWLAAWRDRTPAPALLRHSGSVYGLSLAVYCTSWTFFGGVGTAATAGLDYLPIYLGPILVFTLGFGLVRRILAQAKAQHSTSIADFLSARYGKSASLAALVTVIATCGTLPYMALQLEFGRHDAAGARPGAAHAGRDGRTGADRRRPDGAVRDPVRITPRGPGGRKCRAGADDCGGGGGEARRLARGRRAGGVVAGDGRRACGSCHPGPVRPGPDRRALCGADSDRRCRSPVPAAPVPHELYRSAGRTRQPVDALGVPGLSRAHRSRDRADCAGRTGGAARRHRSRHHRARPPLGERDANARRAGVHRRVFGGDRHDRGGERGAVDHDHQ